MHLATTSLQGFWDKRQKMLFLGSGCLLYRDRMAWSGLDFEILPTPWLNHARFLGACEAVGKDYDEMLALLSSMLNEIHAVDRPQSYWNIILGPWLYHLIHIYYDHYVWLKDADAAGAQSTWLPKSVQSAPPMDYGQFTQWSSTDSWNLRVYTHLLRNMKCGIHCEARDTALPEFPDIMTPEPNNSGLSKNHRLRQYLRRCLWGRNSVLLSDIIIRQSALRYLQIRSLLRVMPWVVSRQWHFEPARNPHEDRQRLATLDVDTEFRGLLSGALPQELPRLYLEDYHTAHAEIEDVAEPAAVLASGSGWHAHERMKFAAAEMRLRGTRLMSVQHGGSYGVKAQMPPETHERRLADRFGVWGWATKRDKHLANLPRLDLPATPYENSGESILLFVGTSHPRFIYRFQSSVLGPTWQEYYDWQQRFVEGLPKNLQQSLLYRPYFRDHDWDQVARLEAIAPEIQVDTAEDIDSTLQRSRLVVIDHNETTLLNCLARNIPVVAYFDSRPANIRDSASPYFDMLRQARILFDGPEAAAEQVADVWDDPIAWWQQKAVQDIRRNFCKQHSFTSKRWYRLWQQFFWT